MHGYPQITRVAKCVPTNKVTNHDLSTFLETSDDWIYSRTGIKERRIVTDETTSDLASKVAKKLSEGLDIKTLDFIIVATMSPDYATPSVACIVQEKIGASEAFAFDINAACSGFVYALSTAEKLLSSGKYQKGLVIGAETMSSLLNWKDRSTAVLFGDGAAGVLLENVSTMPCFIDELIQTDGERAMALNARQTINANPYFKGDRVESEGMKMNGKQIFDFALRDVSKNITSLLQSNPLFSENLDYILAHQANYRILEAISKKTKIPFETFLSNVERYGNTSAASIPILLAEEVEKGTLKIGSKQHVLIAGYGAGLTWGSMLIKL